MSAICPNGHPSNETDYCDVCGSPMTPPAAQAPAPGPAAGAGETGGGEPTPCPHCGTPAAAGALFCENCGYDFTTGTAPASVLSLDPPSTPVAPAAPAAPAALATGAGSAAVDPAPGSGSVDPGRGNPAGGPSGDPAADPDAGSGATPAAGEQDPGSAVTPSDPAVTPLVAPAGSDPATPSAAGAADPVEAPAAVVTPAPRASEAETATPPSGLPTPGIPGSTAWVAEVWIDPDWYAEQQPEDPIPSVGMPQVVPLRARSVLVGRPSRSRGIAPDVDCGADTGVSRRQCQLTTDGQRWWVEDLQSANGTFVSPVGEALPTTPIPAGERRELEEGTRVFVGGWTRIVVRQAFPGEA